MKQIRAYVTDEEAKKIEALAKQNGKSVSQMMKEMLIGVPEISGVDMYDTDHPITENRARRDVPIGVCVSEEEYKFIQSAAKDIPLSTYIRNVVLTSGNSKYTFEINTDDLKELNETAAEINMHVTGFIGALRFRDDVYPADIERLETLLETMNNSVQSLEKQIFNNRNEIRKAAKRSLEKQLKNAIADDIKTRKAIGYSGSTAQKKSVQSP